MELLLVMEEKIQMLPERKLERKNKTKMNV